MSSELAVGVGSISHILKTAFKDTYENEEIKKREFESKKELLRLQEIQKAEEAAAAAEVLAAEKALAIELDKKNKKSSNKPSGSGKDQSLPNENEEIIKSVDEDTIIEEEKEIVLTSGIKLNPEQKKIYEDKLARIDSVYIQQEIDAQQLVHYLHDERSRAKKEENLEEEALKRNGILLGQHIPSLHTKLAIDKSIISKYSTMNKSLANANDLLVQNKTNTLRRTGNLPISDAAEVRKLERKKQKATYVAEIPSLLMKTKAIEVKEMRTKQKFASLLAREQEESKKFKVLYE